MADRSEAEAKKWAQLVAQSWADEKFKQRLIQNPAAVLRERGIEVPAGTEMRVVENTDKVRYIMLPPKPSGNVEELNMAELAGVAGGFTCCGCKFTVQEFPEDRFQPLFIQGTKLA